MIFGIVEHSGPLSQKSAGHMQNSKTNTNTNPSPDPNRYSRRCPDPNARIQKFIHYMAIAAICDNGLSPYRVLFGNANNADFCCVESAELFVLARQRYFCMHI